MNDEEKNNDCRVAFNVKFVFTFVVFNPQNDAPWNVTHNNNNYWKGSQYAKLHIDYWKIIGSILKIVRIYILTRVHKAIKRSDSCGQQSDRVCNVENFDYIFRPLHLEAGKNNEHLPMIKQNLEVYALHCLFFCSVYCQPNK